MATLFRSRDKEEVQELEKVGAKILSVNSEHVPTGPIELKEEKNYVMKVGEERIRLQPHALEDPSVQELISVLLKWVNDVLEERRIRVRDIVEDLYDGQVLSELMEQLTGQKFTTVGVTQSAILQRTKLKTLLDKVDKLLGYSAASQDKRWSVETVHSKEPVSIILLMVALATYFRCKYPIPRDVSIKRIYLKQLNDRLETKLFEEELTGENIGPRAPEPQAERDVFDKLFEEAPEKLEPVKRSLCQFATKVLQELDIVITDLDNQFHNGVYFILMIGLLEGYFVPLYQYHFNPTSVDEKIDNMKLAFKLLEDVGLSQSRVNPLAVVQHDLKSSIRVLYSIFTQYKAKVQQQQAY